MFLKMQKFVYMYIYHVHILHICRILLFVIHEYCKKWNITEVFKVHVLNPHFPGAWEPAHTSSGELTVHTSFLLLCLVHHICSMKSSVTIVFTPRKSEKHKPGHQSPESWLSNAHWHTTLSPFPVHTHTQSISLRPSYAGSSNSSVLKIKF